MKKLLLWIAFSSLTFWVQPALGEGELGPDYSGQEGRAIKSLSDDDISQLLAGKGWGLAKAAELNGVPGPTHLLEMKSEINLSDSQVTDITAIFEIMQSRAILLGTRLVGLERGLDHYFRSGEFSGEKLNELLSGIGRARSELRFVHLSSHQKVAELVTLHQVERYNELRGYSSSDNQCQNIPTGHDPKMFKKHRRCP